MFEQPVPDFDLDPAGGGAGHHLRAADRRRAAGRGPAGPAGRRPGAHLGPGVVPGTRYGEPGADARGPQPAARLAARRAGGGGAHPPGRRAGHPGGQREPI
jgi:hypothetical protein